MSERYCEVIVDIAHSSIDHIYDYRVPEGLTDLPGHRVLVPFGRMDVEGIVLREKDSPGYDREKIKDIIRVLDDVRTVSEEQIRLAGYMCAKYRTTMSFALRFMFPSGVRKDRVSKKERRYVKAVSEEGLLEERRGCFAKNGNVKYKRKLAYIDLLLETGEVPYDSALSNVISGLSEKGIVTVFEKEIMRSPDTGRTAEKREISFTDEQALAIRRIEEKTDKKENCTFLLHGVTGSGKTEVYIETVKHALSIGRTAIVLVPEISITPQILREFSRHFTDEIAVFHSGLSDGERYDEWRRIRDGKAKVVLGARSAVFMPLENIGIIILDEEHSESYKADNYPQYHAAEIANIRAKMNGCPLVLASATPLIDDYFKSEIGMYERIEMKHRVASLPLPDMEIVDMRQEFQRGNRSIVSAALRKELGDVLARGEQAMIFLNRRGYSSSLICPSCGEVIKCPHCDLPLKYHKDRNDLLCHYCGRAFRVPAACPSCGEKALSFSGTGTEKAVEEIQKLFPTANIMRMDFDSTRKKDSYFRIFEDFRDHKADILVGTQMIARGLDFPNVTLSAILSADGMLFSGDYREEERTFAMIEQVGGRAGRRKKGKVIVQTHNPTHYAILYAKDHDYHGFYETEIRFRKETLKPPYSRVFRIVFSGRNEERVKKVFTETDREMKEKLAPHKKDILLYAAEEAPVRKLDDSFRYHILIKTTVNRNLSGVRDIIYDIWEKRIKHSGINIGIDVDPYSVN